MGVGLVLYSWAAAPQSIKRARALCRLWGLARWVLNEDGLPATWESLGIDP